MFRLTLLVILVVGESFAQVVQSTGCPAVNTTENFDIEKFEGEFYIYQSFFFLLTYGGKCGTKDYYRHENGTVGVYMTFLSADDETSNIIALSTVDGTDASKMTATTPQLPLMGTGMPEWILDTDYTSYAIVYACAVYDDDNHSMSSMFVLSRERYPSDTTKEAITAVLEKYDINTEYLYDVDQVNCAASPRHQD